VNRKFRVSLEKKSKQRGTKIPCQPATP